MGPIDPGYAFSRAAVGHLKPGKWAQVVLVIGDCDGPLMWYDYVNGTWIAHKVADIKYGHTLGLLKDDPAMSVPPPCSPHTGYRSLFPRGDQISAAYHAQP